MKVLQILPEMESGGVERGVLELAEHLVQSGHESLVVSNGGRLIAALETAGTRHISLPVHRKSIRSLAAVGSLRKVLMRERPAIVHIRSRIPGWITWLALRSMKPEVRGRLVSTVHGFYSANAYSAIMTRGERVIAVSESIRDYVLKNYPRTRPVVIRVIPRGIEPLQYPRGFKPAPEWEQAWRAKFPVLAGKKVLVLPGRITRLKGHEDFIHLIASLAKAGLPVHGLIVGEAHPKKIGYLDELKTHAARSGAGDHITFTGHRSDYREIAAVSDVVFSLSTQPESFGRTTLEALALGCPVVGYDHGGVGEQLRQFFPQGRVPPGDTASLRATTQRVLASRPDPALIKAPYTLAAMCESTVSVYHELVPSDAQGGQGHHAA